MTTLLDRFVHAIAFIRNLAASVGRAVESLNCDEAPANSAICTLAVI